MHNKFNMMRKETVAGPGLFKAFSHNLSGGILDNNRKSQSWLPASLLKFEPGTSQIRKSAVNHLAATLGENLRSVDLNDVKEVNRPSKGFLANFQSVLVSALTDV